MGISVRKQVFSLALPVVLSSLLQRSVGIVDIFLVGGLGATSIAAVGIAQIMVFVVMSVSWGINTGATVLVSQLWGAGRKGDAAQVSYQAMAFVIIASVAIMILGYLFGWRAAAFLGAGGEVQTILFDYTRILFTFIIFTISINVLS
ncbi:MAG: MATE family efflux transporter, partial [Nitrospirota bacterium]|nr:MATE family efflux transporter [Nitrospirota bacterium]